MDYSLFEWDNEKNISNKEKHKIGFEEAVLVFDDPFHIEGTSKNPLKKEVKKC